MDKNLKTEKEIQEDYNRLRDYFGHGNLRFDVQQEIIEQKNSDSLFDEESSVRYIKMRVTHIPTGKVAFGTSYDNELENAVEALNKLKEEVKITNAQQDL